MKLKIARGDYHLTMSKKRLRLVRRIRLRHSYWDPNREIVYDGAIDGAPSWVDEIVDEVLGITAPDRHAVAETSAHETEVCDELE